MEKTKLVFEYSWENKTFNAENPNNRKLFGYVYDHGIDNVEVLAMVTDNNTISNDFSKQLSNLFKIIEINKGTFINYCTILESEGKVKVPIPQDEKILNNQKLLSNYWNRETFIQVCPKLIQILLDTHIDDINTHKKQQQLYAKYEYVIWFFPLYIDNDVYESLFEGKSFLDRSKLTTVGEDLMNFPYKIRVESFMPYCARRFAEDEKRFNEVYKDVIEHPEQADENKKNSYESDKYIFDHPEKTLNFINYVVSLD